jgi:methylenetetrahydrofolate reductase (NADPH)
MRISVELIPRGADDLAAQLDDLASLGPVDTVNLPDIVRFPLRSWDACGAAVERGLRPIPHLRAIDVDPARPLAFLGPLTRAGVTEVLVVAGDAPADMSRAVYDTSSEALIRRIKRERPDWTVYAALDPYRQGFAAERDYLLRKLDAGADGVFTQPFFDLRLVEVWGEVLEPLRTTVFWGATSVTSRRSARYWTTRNKALLPRRFEATLAHSRDLAGALLRYARDHDDHVYFMPIRASASAYLRGLV